MLPNKYWLTLYLWCLVFMLTEWPSGCDGEKKCSDGSDGKGSNCTPSLCEDTQFQCTNKYCIPEMWVCDGDYDCPDNSDETDSSCSKHYGTCQADQFTCQNKRCISLTWVCDHEDDCGDNSDEKNCEPPTCQPGTQFTCSNNLCIPYQWQCDGEKDCRDGLDEVGCEGQWFGHILNKCTDDEFCCSDNITRINRRWICDGDNDCPDGSDESRSTCQFDACRLDQFQCSDRSCISGNLYCDGTEDCPDGTDEKNCTIVKIACDPAKEFDCGNGTCIPLNSTCDIKPDRLGSENEQPDPYGKNECLFDNGGCEHICIELPTGFQCKCRNGYKLINNLTCDDIDECMEPGSCSQICENLEGGFKCDCTDGYHIDQQNSNRCRAIEGHATLLFAETHGIRRAALDHQEITPIRNSTDVVIALDYVFRTGMIFWIHSSDHKIYKAPIDNSDNQTIAIDFDHGTSEGIAIDWIHDNIYWTQRRESKESIIAFANIEGSMRKTLFSNDLQKPRGIALDPSEGWIFWTDWGDDARIERAGMDGSHRSIIVRNELKWPNGLTLDLVGKKLYWVDANLHYIASCNYDGSGRRVIIKSHDIITHPFGITTFEDHIFWTDWGKNNIFKANKFTGNEFEVSLPAEYFQKPNTIHVYHPVRQPDGINHCQSDNGNCSHICLPAPKIDSLSPLITCACPDGLILLQDKSTCVDNVTTTDAPTTQVVTEPSDPVETTEKPTEISEIQGSGQGTCLWSVLEIARLRQALQDAEQRANLYKSQLEATVYF